MVGKKRDWQNVNVHQFTLNFQVLMQIHNNKNYWPWPKKSEKDMLLLCGQGKAIFLNYLTRKSNWNVKKWSQFVQICVCERVSLQMLEGQGWSSEARDANHQHEANESRTNGPSEFHVFFCFIYYSFYYDNRNLLLSLLRLLFFRHHHNVKILSSNVMRHIRKHWKLPPSKSCWCFGTARKKKVGEHVKVPREGSTISCQSGAWIWIFAIEAFFPAYSSFHVTMQIFFQLRL